MEHDYSSFDVFSRTCLLFHSRYFECLTGYLLRAVWRQGLLPDIPEDHLRILSKASSLHDIGKCALSEQIVNCTTKLTRLEFEIMQQHTTLGAMMIDKALPESFGQEFQCYAKEIALYHHERWDGSGYPAGLKGTEIPTYVQVVSIADAYDALRTFRSYRPALSHRKAVDMIVSGNCGEFAPQILAEFIATIDTADLEIYEGGNT